MAQPSENTCEQNALQMHWMFPKMLKSKFQGSPPAPRTRDHVVFQDKKSWREWKQNSTSLSECVLFHVLCSVALSSGEQNLLAATFFLKECIFFFKKRNETAN